MWDIGFGVAFMGYRFGLGSCGIQVWDWVLWDIGLGLGLGDRGLGLCFWDLDKKQIGIGILGCRFGIGSYGV